MFDLLIKNALIVDGSGTVPFNGDVAITGDSILAVGEFEGGAKRVLSVQGLVVTPGFIDIHTHADMGVLSFPSMANYLLQGVTTVVSGNCGLTLAPCNADHLEGLREYLEPFLPSDCPDFSWTSFGEFLAKIELARPAINLAPLVGHGTLRVAVAGFENRACTQTELKSMCRLLSESLDEGCHGLSTGLFYPPGSYANLTELEALFEVLKNHNAIYTSHLRSEGRYLVESVSEAIYLGEKYGVSVELSHHKASPRPFWGKVKTTLSIARAARSRGSDVSCDAYPYDASCTTITALLPPEALEGGVSAMLGRISDPEERHTLARTMSDDTVIRDLFIRDVGWDSIFIISCPGNRSLEGITLSALVGEPPLAPQVERFFELLLSIRGEALIGAKSMSGEDIDTIFQDDTTIIASDSWVEDPDDPGKCHPRAFGTFPRFIGLYARERGLFRLEEAVRRVTALPARKFHFQDRGLIAPGMKADLTIFDADKFLDKATFIEPKRRPDGLNYVLVNGEVAVEDGNPTGLRVGRVIRSRSA